MRRITAYRTINLISCSWLLAFTNKQMKDKQELIFITEKKTAHGLQMGSM